MAEPTGRGSLGGKMTSPSKLVAEAAPTFPLAGRGGPGGRQLPNPLRRLPDLLLAPTGRIMLSRIRGDLNLSSVIVGERPDGGVDRVLVFDLANCEPGRAQAVDFAHLEAEIWRRIPESAEVPVTEDELIAARDGRRDALSRGTARRARGGDP